MLNQCKCFDVLPPTKFPSNSNNFLKRKFVYKKKPKIETNFGIKKNLYFREYYECIFCGHLYSKHKLDISKIYSGKYIEATYGSLEAVKKKFNFIINLKKSASDNKKRAIRVEKFIKSKSKKKKLSLLDVGAGLGVFAHEMKLKGFKTYGFETDTNLKNHLKNYVKINLFDKKNKIKKFDLISINKVLEHVSDPRMFLLKYKKYLNKDSYFYIEVPDTKAKINGKGSEEFAIEHHHVFTTLSLKNFLKSVGLSLIIIKSIKEPSGKFTIYCFCKLV
tara:strand:+ start:6131 stop:6958 length:828 start_codon:yes stop_codon:yes gene_type:complete